MRFTTRQEIPAPLPEVEDALLDPAFLTRLAELPRLGRPQLLGTEADGDEVRQRVRYRFSGDLSPAVTAVVDPGKLTWVEHTTYDRRRHRGEHRIVPDHYRDRLRASYTTQLDEAAGTTQRRIEGELAVRFPLVGGRVERAIVSGLVEHAGLEAGVLAQWLTDRAEGG
ncbi:MAG: DUF2505 family protein [Acidimicrobiales bacterium]